MERLESAAAHGRERERAKKKYIYIVRNTSDSAIGVPRTSPMATVELLSTVAGHYDGFYFSGDGPKDTPGRGALRIYRKFNITQKLETARGILPDIYTV